MGSSSRICGPAPGDGQISTDVRQQRRLFRHLAAARLPRRTSVHTQKQAQQPHGFKELDREDSS